MKEQSEGILDFLAALLVLFTAMLDSRVSAGLAVLLLVALGLYKFARGRRRAS